MPEVQCVEQEIGLVLIKDSKEYPIYFKQIQPFYRTMTVAQLHCNNTEISLDENLFEQGSLNDVLVSLKEFFSAFSDYEIQSIIDEMPLLKKFGEQYHATMNDVAIIWRDHFLEENISLLNSFVISGVKPECIMAIDKCDSTLHRSAIMHTFQYLGYDTQELDNNMLTSKVLLDQGRKMIYNFIEKHQNKKIVIIDDGAIVTQLLGEESIPNLLGVIELTEMGLRRIKRSKKLPPYPILNVAKTKLKKYITYPEISLSIVNRIVQLLGGQKIIGRSAVVMGYGDLGSILCEHLRNMGMNVSVCDNDTFRLIMAAENAFRTYRDSVEAIRKEHPFLLVGASGYNSITYEALLNMPDKSYVTTGATADLKVFDILEEKHVNSVEIEGYGSQYIIDGKHITRLGNGRSVNLYYSEAIPNQANDIFKTSIFLSTLLLVRNAEQLNKRLHLNTVDDWLEESDLYNQYYNMYFAKE